MHVLRLTKVCVLALHITFLLAYFVSEVSGQISSVPAAAVPGATAATSQTAAASDSQLLQQRFNRAKALAAAHNVNSAISELDAIRVSAREDSVRDIARIMLMNLYLEQADEAKAFVLLEETFKARIPGQEKSSRIYFAVAGQAVRGVRERVSRYREFGFSAGLADQDLPPEAAADLGRLRNLLERVINQAKDIVDDNDKSLDALALLEDAANLRAGLARSEQERAQWLGEFNQARELLAEAETRISTVRESAAQVRPERARMAQSSDSIENPVNEIEQVAPATPSGSSAPAPPLPRAAATPGSTDGALLNKQGSAAVVLAQAPDAKMAAGQAPKEPGTASRSASDKPAGDTKTNKSTQAPAAEKKPDDKQSTGSTGANHGSNDAPVVASKSLVIKKGSDQPRPVNVGSLLDRATSRIPPVYPSPARLARIAGVVVVEVIIDEHGLVTEVSGTSGPEMLRQAAVDAARRWKFRPMMINGEAVRAAGSITFNFTL